VFLVMPVVEAAQLSPQQFAAYEGLNDTGRIQVIIQLAKVGNANAVEALLEKYPLQGPYARNRGLYIKGLLQKNQGDFTGAAETFRSALADDPSLTLVRSELAETLVILEEDESAAHHLRLLAADAPNEKAAATVRSFLDQVDSRTPYKFSGYVSFAPSTNVNNGTKQTTVYSPFDGFTGEIGDDRKAKSGVGLSAGGNAAYSKRIGNDYLVIAAAGANARIYDDEAFNSFSLSQSLEFRRLTKNGYLALGLIASQSLDQEDGFPDYVSYGPRIAMSQQIGAEDRISGSIIHEWRNSQNKGGPESTALTFDAAWSHSFGATFATTVFGGLDIIKTDIEKNSYYTMAAGLSIYKELPAGITVSASGQIAKSEFAAHDILLNTTREDTQLSGSLTLTKRDFNIYGFAPAITYSYANNFSNSNPYDFDRHGLDVRLTKDF
jgi:outer membrane protein